MHPANVRRLAAATFGVALPVWLSAVVALAAGQQSSVTPIATGLKQTVTVGPMVITQTIDPLTGLMTSQRSQETTVDVEQFNRPDIHPCTNEPLVLDGRSTIRFRFSTGSDGRIHQTMHFESQGQGVAQYSTAKYVFNANSELSSNDGGAGAGELTLTAHENYIRTNESVAADDFSQHMTFHFTRVNDVTTSAFVDNFRMECR